MRACTCRRASSLEEAPGVARAPVQKTLLRCMERVVSAALWLSCCLLCQHVAALSTRTTRRLGCGAQRRVERTAPAAPGETENIGAPARAATTVSVRSNAGLDFTTAPVAATSFVSERTLCTLGLHPERYHRPRVRTPESGAPQQSRDLPARTRTDRFEDG